MADPTTPFIQSDDEAHRVANLLQQGKITGADADRARQALRIYTQAAQSGDKDIPAYHAGLSDVARDIMKGASFNWLPGKETESRQRAAQFTQEHPAGSFGLEALGGIGTGAATAYGLRRLAQHAPNTRLGRLAGVLSLADQAASRTPISTGQSIKRGALLGGGAGALAGAGSTPTYDPADMASAAAVQGGIGTVLGPLQGLGMKYGLIGPAGKLINRLRGVEPTPGGAAVAKAMSADQISPRRLQWELDRANRTGAPSTVSDVGGPNVQALARAVASKPGQQVDQMTADLARRNEDAPSRVTQLVQRFLRPVPYGDELRRLTDNLYTQARPMYQQAYAQFPALQSQSVRALLNNKWGLQALRQANNLMKAEGLTAPKKDATEFSLQYLDYVKRAMDDQISKAERGGSNQLGWTLRHMRDNLRDEVDRLTTGPQGQPSPYAAARAQYAGDLEVRDALLNGRTQFGGPGVKWSPDELTNNIRRMSLAERDAFRSGAAESLLQKIAGSESMSEAQRINPAQSVLSNRGVAQRLQALFTSPSEYRQFVSALQQEMDNFARARGVMASGAAGRTAAAARGVGSPTLGELGHAATMFATGHWPSAATSLGRALAPHLAPEGVTEQAAELLRSGSPDALRALYNQVGPFTNRQLFGNLASLGSIPGGITAASGTLTGPRPEDVPVGGPSP